METLRSLSPPQAASITASAAVTIHFMLASRPLRCIFVFLSVLTAFDQFELVTVRVLHESDHRAAMLHRPGLARHFAAALFVFVASGAYIVHADGDMHKSVAELVLVHAPVVGELDHRLLALVSVADEGERELAVGIILATQQLHAEHVGVERERAVELADPQHGVQYAHKLLLINRGG